MIYEKVKALCDERDMSIRALESATGIKNGTIGGWRDHEPTLSRLQAVANYFDKPISHFLELPAEKPGEQAVEPCVT